MPDTTLGGFLSEVGKTNLYYTEEERHVIRQSLSDTKGALQRLQEEKAVLDRRENELQSTIQRFHVALGPIKQLPDDVLCYIFKIHCQDVSPARLYLPSRYTELSRITLTHVCSAWRFIMLNTPSLWNDVYLDLNWLDSKRIEKVLGFAREWLSRAGELPCSIEVLEGDDFASGLCRQRPNLIKELISPYKFKKLSVLFTHDNLRDFLALPEEKLSCIEELRLRYYDPDTTAPDVPVPPGPPLDFSKLSKITSFSLLPRLPGAMPRLSICGEYARFVSMPWHQLRHIQINVVLTVAFCMTMLRLSSAVLETCELGVSSDQSLLTTLSSAEPIHCPHLRSLKVDTYYEGLVPDRFPDPFLLLRLPNLKSLTLGSPDHISLPVNLQTIIRMKDLSCMSLEELSITDTNDSIDFRALLVSMPSLRRVELPTSVEVTNEAMEELGAGSIGPHLEDLTIKNPNLEIGNLLRMVKARSTIERGANTQQIEPTLFKSVSLSCEDPEGELQMEYRDCIEKLNQSGVRLRVIWRNPYEDSDEYSLGWRSFDDDMYDDDDDDDDYFAYNYY